MMYNNWLTQPWTHQNLYCIHIETCLDVFEKTNKSELLSGKNFKNGRKFLNSDYILIIDEYQHMYFFTFNTVLV